MAGGYEDPTAIFWQRFTAWMIDWALVGAVAVAAAAYQSSVQVDVPAGDPACDLAGNACTTYSDGTASMISASENRIFMFLVFSAVALAVGNLVVLQGRTGATIGKFALGIRTVNKRDERPGMLRCLARTIGGYIDLLCSGLVGILAYNTSKNHRRVGDMIGGTVVVKKEIMRGHGAPSGPGQPPYSGMGYAPQAFQPPVADPVPTAWAPVGQQQPTGWPPPAPQQPPAWHPEPPTPGPAPTTSTSRSVRP